MLESRLADIICVFSIQTMKFDFLLVYAERRSWSIYHFLGVCRDYLEDSLDNTAAVHEFRIPPKALFGLHVYCPVHFDAFHAVLVDVTVHVSLLKMDRTSSLKVPRFVGISIFFEYDMSFCWLEDHIVSSKKVGISEYTRHPSDLV